MNDLTATAEAYGGLGADDLGILRLKHRLRDTREETSPIFEEFAAREAAYQDEVKRFRDLWEQANAELLAIAKEAKERLADDDAMLRKALIERFQNTGEKTFDKQLSVRVNTRLEYAEAEAIAWAKTNAPILIVEAIDRKAFEALPHVKRLDFVAPVYTASAVIAADLND